MGDIRQKDLNRFELNQPNRRIKRSITEFVKDNNKGKQVIQLNGKSSLIFANLTALLCSCEVEAVEGGGFYIKCIF